MFEFRCNLYAEEMQLGCMDARRDTPVIPCGLKVDITCAAEYGTERGNGQLEGQARWIGTQDVEMQVPQLSAPCRSRSKSVLDEAAWQTSSRGLDSDGIR